MRFNAETQRPQREAQRRPLWGEARGGLPRRVRGESARRGWLPGGEAVEGGSAIGGAGLQFNENGLGLGGAVLGAVEDLVGDGLRVIDVADGLPTGGPGGFDGEVSDGEHALGHGLIDAEIL